MKLAMYQMQNAGSVEANLEKSLAAIAEAAKKGADLILFPEVQLTEFFPQYPGQDVAHYAVTIDHPIVERFRAACREHSIMACPKLYLAEGGKYYDVSFLIGADGEIIGLQKMVHIRILSQIFMQITKVEWKSSHRSRHLLTESRWVQEKIATRQDFIAFIRYRLIVFIMVLTQAVQFHAN